MKRTDAFWLVAALQANYAIYSVAVRHEECTGIRITPSVYTTVAEVDYFAAAVEQELKSL